MSFWVSETKPVVVEPRAERRSTWEQWHKKIDASAKEAEPAALLKAEEYLSLATAEHDDDVANYSFECRRFGDFLSVFVQRRKIETGGVQSVQKFSTAINLAKVQTISLVPGKASGDGFVTYRLRLKKIHPSPKDFYDDGWFELHHSSEWPRGQVEDFEFQSEPEFPLRPWRTPFGEIGSDRYDYHYNRRSGLKTPFPTYAKDDIVLFSGLGSGLYVPYGVGQSVHDAILKELAKSYVAPPTPG